jgi:hypothetical protein
MLELCHLLVAAAWRNRNTQFSLPNYSNPLLCPCSLPSNLVTDLRYEHIGLYSLPMVSTLPRIKVRFPAPWRPSSVLPKPSRFYASSTIKSHTPNQRSSDRHICGINCVHPSNKTPWGVDLSHLIKFVGTFHSSRVDFRHPALKPKSLIRITCLSCDEALKYLPG